MLTTLLKVELGYCRLSRALLRPPREHSRGRDPGGERFVVDDLYVATILSVSGPSALAYNPLAKNVKNGGVGKEGA